MLSKADILAKARCGELSFLCCLSEDELMLLQRWLDRMPTSVVRFLYKHACRCDYPGGGTNPTPTPDPSGVDPSERCAEQVSSALCALANDQTTRAAIVLITVTLQASFPASLAVTAPLVELLDTVTAECESGGISAETISDACKVYRDYTAWRDSLDPATLAVLMAIDAPLISSKLFIVLDACCKGGS